MKYSPNFRFTILVSESCPLAQSLPYRLPCGFPAQIKSVPAGQIRAQMAERPIDGLILSADELNTAQELAEHSYTAVLILAGEGAPGVVESCARSGVMVCTADSLSAVLPSFLACCARLRSLCTETASLKRKLDDTRIVTRAKLLLMSRLKMSENEAHRYIEKTAMDTGAKRREVAESIIRTYEE